LADLFTLIAGELLEFFEFGDGFHRVAIHDFANDLQAHLEPDEALQRAIVKIVRDALAFGLPGVFGFGAVHHGLAGGGA
jgi:hypothetical protein